ncbi:hypothetical protein [Pseudonocardia sp. Ae505_Ps2]|uniref:hypothetical protein n=1 Tax=Pseudonocardia sp. Ae505_Ps2 TaxID=1885034 RepID=UPI00094E9CEC|nr:hypothetical protein [Pseudonocardia sp. Ae505_Ps2]OLM11034.1 hypothetical protein Ae505Ps2_1157 [Pseudonocardia sp. Ae505_Ps2]
MTSTYGRTAGGPAEHAGAVAPGHADPAHTDTLHTEHRHEHSTVDPRTGGVHHAGGVPIAGGPRLDRIRWGAVWIGALTTFAVNIVLQLLFFAFGWLTIGGAPGTTTAAVVSVVIGLLAFFLGGMATGSSTVWDNPADGVVNALAVWVLTTMLLVGLALAGGWSVLAMGVSAVAAAIGGAVGARMWPGAAQRTARV